MLFNTISFWLFFAVVLSPYLLLPRRGQNVLLLVASYFFYACWNWRFVGLLLLSTSVDWNLANAIGREHSPSRAKRLVALSVAINLLFLGFFKYFNFFIDSFSGVLLGLGLQPASLHLRVVLPVGISFYTFQSISYIVDVYRKEVEPAKNPIDFALFVAFFPHMVAGPIMHSSALLPQMQQQRRLRWQDVTSGFHLAMWGLFKKVVIADNLAPIVTEVFQRQLGFHPGPIHLGALAFAFQIYCDFSGYSDIARGVARIMGFSLMENFKHPYFSTSITDFWRRWHISLSSWLRDYLYIPLGGNRRGDLRSYRNLFLTMLLGGLWHGAAWKFVIWGGYQAVLLSAERALGGRRLIVEWEDCRSLWAKLGWLVRVLVCFQLVLAGWIMFRCEHTGALWFMLKSFMDVRGWFAMPPSYAFRVLGYAAPLLIVEAFQYKTRDEAVILRANVLLRAAVYFLGMYAFILLGRFESNAFIYFQF